MTGRSKGVEAKADERTSPELATRVPTVEIVMGCYDGARYVLDQLASIQRQTYPQWRLLIRDDGSRDETVSLLKTAASLDHRISVIEDQKGNLGVNENFRELLRHTTARYVMFSDQDDYWLPEKIAVSIDKMLEVEVKRGDVPVLVHTDSTVTDKDLKLVKERFIGPRARTTGLSTVLFANSVQGATTLINGPLRERILRLDPLLPYDYHSALVAETVGFRAYVDRSCMLYRQHDKNAIGSNLVTATSTASRGSSPTFQIGLDASASVIATVEGCIAGEDVARRRELERYVYVISGKSRLKRLCLALLGNYRFARRRDRFALLLHIMKR